MSQGFVLCLTRWIKFWLQLGRQQSLRRLLPRKGSRVSCVCYESSRFFPVPPAIIFSRVRYHKHLYTGAPTGTLKLHNDTGYMTTPLFLKFLEHFCAYTKPSEKLPVPLLLDNHSSHVNLSVTHFCRAHHIHLLSLPPHCTHELQPLDKVFFMPLKTTFATLVANFPIGKQSTQL